MAEEPEGVWREPTADPWWKRIARGQVRAALKETPLGQSYLVNLGRGAYRTTVSRRRTGEVDFRYDVQVDGRVVPFNTANNIYDLTYFRAVADGDLSPAILEPALASFAEISMEAGFRPMVIYTPAPYTAYERFGPFEAGGVAEVMRRFSRTQREWLRDAARRYGLDHLDLTPVLQQAAAVSPEPLYFPRNQHLTAAGHRVIAAAIAEALRRPAPSKALPADPAISHGAGDSAGQAVAAPRPSPAVAGQRSAAAGSDPTPRPGDEAGTGPEPSLEDAAAGDGLGPYAPQF